MQVGRDIRDRLSLPLTVSYNLRRDGRGYTGKTKSTCTSGGTEYMCFVVVLFDRRRLVGRCTFSDSLS